MSRPFKYYFIINATLHNEQETDEQVQLFSPSRWVSCRPKQIGKFPIREKFLSHISTELNHEKKWQKP